MDHPGGSFLDLFDLLDEEGDTHLNFLDSLFGPDLELHPQGAAAGLGTGAAAAAAADVSMQAAPRGGPAQMAAAPDAHLHSRTAAMSSQGAAGLPSSGPKAQQGYFCAQAPAAAGSAPQLFSSAEAATRYADTAALVAAAQAQMDAASPGHGAEMQLQNVVSATSLQLQQMARTALSLGKGTAAPSTGSGVGAHPQQQQQQQQPSQQCAPPLPQQLQGAVQQQQQQGLQAPVLQAMAQQQQLQQQQQQQPSKRKQKPPPFSAATLAKAAAITGTGTAAAASAAAAEQGQAQRPAAAPYQPLTAAQPGVLQASTVATAGSMGPLQDASMLDAFQRVPSLGAAGSGALDPAVAAAAAAAAGVGAGAGPMAAAVAQQQGWGFTLPEQFHGVMLTPAGAVTGVALGQHQLVHWVQGLQHLASQQQVAQAAHRQQKAARKKDKLADLQAQLGERQAQLQALSLENLALSAKARALEQLVKSAGDDVTLMEEQLAALSIQQEKQEHSQQAAAAAEAAVAALQGQATMQQQQELRRRQQAVERQQRAVQQQQQQQPVQPQPPPQPQQQRELQQAEPQPQQGPSEQQAPKPQPEQQPQQQQPPQPQQPPQQRQQQQQQQQPAQRAAGVESLQFRQLHRQVLQDLMQTPLESLEDILGGLAPNAQAAAAAAGGPATPPTAPTGGGVLQAAAGALLPSAQSGIQAQQQQEWSPPQQQQQSLGHAQLSPQRQALLDAAGVPGSGGSFDSSASSTAPQASRSNSLRQSSMEDVTSSQGGRPGSSLSDPGAQGNLFGTATQAAAAAQAAAAGTGGGLLLAGWPGSQQQAIDAATKALELGTMRRPAPLQEKLPEIQAVHKRVVLQLMPLLLQVQQERIQCNLMHTAGDSSGALQAQQALLNSPAMQQLTRVMLQYSKDIHTFAIANRLSTYELYTLNIETGVLGQPPPDGHWKRVAGMLKDRLSRQALADLCVARQLYSSTLMRIKQQRQLLVLQLAQLISNTHSRSVEATYRTSEVFDAVQGLHCEGFVLLDAVEKNMRKEFTLEGVYQWMTHHIIPMHVLAELVVHSYPYKADIHMTLQELMRDQPMPCLTALQQLQLKQLQDQQAALLQAHQAQQQAASAAAMMAQQQAAAQLQVLQQQRGQLAAGVLPTPGTYSSMLLH